MDGSAERALYQHLGEDALLYLLNTNSATLHARLEEADSPALTVDQVALLDQLVAIDQQTGGWQGDTSSEWASRLGSLSDPVPTLSLGNLVRQLAGGEITSVPENATDLERELYLLAIDAYPGLIVRESDDPFDRRIGLPVSFFRHPANEAFQQQVREDDILGPLFANESEHSGPSAQVTRSIGQGGGVQLWTLSSTLLSSAWAIACLNSRVPTIDEFLSAVQSNVLILKTALAGKKATIPARVGLTGVLLPEGLDEIELGWGRIRRSDERDAVFVKSTSLTGQLTGTNEAGETAVINYSGDLVLELDVPYAVSTKEWDPTTPWPEELLISSQALVEAVENVRLGLVLAFPERRVVVHTSWTVQIDPLVQGRFAGWNNVTTAVGLMPTQLTKQQVNEWKTWTSRIGKHRIPTIGVAIRRMLASVAERRSMDDVLVDAVIVWENLFGATTETTLRVSSSLAWLLGTSSADRKLRLEQYKKIYGFRSRVVHGTPTIDQEKLNEYGMQAVQISIDALRAVFDKRVELLKIPNSEKRSLELMHRGD
jgi:hypothetical protein